MTHATQNSSRAFRSMLVRGALLIALPGPFLSGHVAQAQPAPSCTAALDSLMTTWHTIGFVEPSKPMQMIVAGRHGYATTGGHFYFMQREIGAGARDCEAGRDADA